MKKKHLRLLVLLVVVIAICPIAVTAGTNAKTLAELRKELSALESKASTNNANKNATKSKINSATSSIATKKTEIETNQESIASATAESEALTKEIESGKKELSKLIAAYQIAKENNVYMDYVFSSKSYEELVYRSALSEQLMGYISTKIIDWDEKITKNEELKETLTEKSAQLEKDITSLSSSIDEWGSYLTSLDNTYATIDEEIKSVKELINYYKSIGCGENENLDSCVQVRGDTTFIRPLTKGTITSYYGYRTHPVTGQVNSFHSGVDIGGNAEGTPVYSVANGMVGMIVRKSSCGGNMVYVYHTVKGVQYTSVYMHLLTINVSVGQQLSSSSVVGTVGGGYGTDAWDWCSTGAHLHLGLATGWYGQTYTSSSQWSSHLVNPQSYINIPNKGIWFYSRY